MPLRISECKYPSGDIYGVFFMGQHEIGRADKIGGFWRLRGARKVLTEEGAAKAMIDRAITKAREDERNARKMLEALRLFCGGSLPSDGRAAPG